MASVTSSAPADRSQLERPAGVGPDRFVRWGLTGLAGLILLLILYFFIRLFGESWLSMRTFGLNFVFGNDWDASKEIYHGAALVVGTIITSAIALAIGVPIAVSAALYLTEMCPGKVRAPLAFLVDLLAAVPSVVYGLWGFLVLGPKLIPFERWIANTFSFIPWIGGGANQISPGNYFIAGLVLAIMILPIVCAISREVITTVPPEHREAALALGATRWEMLRMAVLPYSRAGITGAAMLGLGRAIGETIAVVLVIGDAPTIGAHLFSQGYTLAAVIANEFGEAANDKIHASALFEAGLVLFLLTLLVNILARRFVIRGSHGRGEPGGITAAVVAGGDA